MSYISLYRKYRPNTFDSIIGQEHIIRVLKNQIKSRNIGHAYLFTGTRGTGKTSAAKIFARAVNCLDALNGSPCGKCKVCKELESANNMDILEIDAASNNGVDEVRDIRDKVKYPPSIGNYKVYIIDEVHMLSTGAFNALLKTLEEPPSHIIFILATTEVHKLPQTILSRCMRFDFRLVSSELISDLIKNIYEDMNKDYEPEAIMAIANAGEGSVRDALSIADMCMSYRDSLLTFQDVIEVVGVSSPEMIMDLVKSILTNDLEQIFIIVDKCAKAGKNYSQLGKDISNMIRNLIFIKNSSSANDLMKYPSKLFNDMTELSSLYDTVRLLTALEHICKIEGGLRYSAQPRIAFEAALTRAAIVGNTLNEDELSRLKVLEDRVKQMQTAIDNNDTKKDILIDINQDNKVKKPKTIKADKIIQLKELDIQEKTEELGRVEDEFISSDTDNAKNSQLDNNVQAIHNIEDDSNNKEPYYNLNDNKQDNTNELDLKKCDEQLIFGEVKRVHKGTERAKEIIGKVLRELRNKKLYHLHGIFGYNDVKVWIEDKKYYIQTYDDYGFKQLTDGDNHKVFKNELMRAAEGSIEKLVILPPKNDIDINKSIDKVKELFDRDIITTKK